MISVYIFMYVWRMLLFMEYIDIYEYIYIHAQMLPCHSWHLSITFVWLCTWMYIYIYTCVDVVSSYFCWSDVLVYVHTYTRICVCEYMHMRYVYGIYVYTYIYEYGKYIYTWIYTNIYIWIYIYLRIFAHDIYIHMWKIYICIYIWIALTRPNGYTFKYMYIFMCRRRPIDLKKQIKTCVVYVHIYDYMSIIYTHDSYICMGCMYTCADVCTCIQARTRYIHICGM